jgi:hypothetical protein
MISLLAIARITGPASASGRVSPTSGRLPALRGEQVGRRFGRAPGADGRARGEQEVCGGRGARPAFVLAGASGPRRRGCLCPVGEALAARIGANIVAGPPEERARRRRATADALGGRLLTIGSRLAILLTPDLARWGAARSAVMDPFGRKRRGVACLPVTRSTGLRQEIRPKADDAAR